MAFGDVRGQLSGSAGSITNPFAATGSVAVSVGDLGIAVFAERSTLTVGTVTDNLGNTWTALNAGTDGGNATGRTYYRYFGSAGTLTSVSGTATASSADVAFAVTIFEGPFTATPLDANPANSTDTASPFTCPATGTLAQADELIIAWMATGNGITVATSALAATSPNVLQQNVATGTGSNTISATIGSQVVAATTTVSPAFTSTTTPGANVVGTASFKKGTSNQDLTPSLYSDADTFHTPTITTGAVGLTPSLFTDGDTFHAPTVNSVYPLTPALFTDADTFHTPAVTVGAVNLTPSLFTDADTFHTPIVNSVYPLTPALYSDADTFHSPTVTVGAVNLTPALYTDADTFHTPTITTGAVDLAPALFTDGDTFHTPTVALAGGSFDVKHSSMFLMF